MAKDLEQRSSFPQSLVVGGEEVQGEGLSKPVLELGGCKITPEELSAAGGGSFKSLAPCRLQ